MISVVGSLNMDLVTEVERFPGKGETLHGTRFSTIYGGKGANQAVAAARLGGNVAMTGRVGEDAFGEKYCAYLENEGVNTDNVKPVTHLPTGTASITVAEKDNVIIIVAGANGAVTKAVVEEAKETISASDVLLVQLEIPDEAVEEAMKIAKEAGATVILNPAPFSALPTDWWQWIDYVTPNEHEAAQLRESETFHPSYEEKLIVTEGSKGASYMKDGSRVLVPAPQVEVIDTTGAGDTFNGALAASLDQGMALHESIARSVRAASLSVTMFGAQGGMPTNEDLKKYEDGVTE